MSSQDFFSTTGQESYEQKRLGNGLARREACGEPRGQFFVEF